MKNYRIAIVGLGHIGGSICKAIKKNTKFLCYGIEKDKEVIEEALKKEFIEYELPVEELCNMDFVFVCLYPHDTIDFINQNHDNFGEDTIVIDCCGVKKEIVDKINTKGINFVGGHPMAGGENSGYKFSRTRLFRGAYFVLTPIDVSENVVLKVTNLVMALGLRDITVTTPEKHDQVIAYTSQLAHAVSAAYILNDTFKERTGFSAGSYADLTRVAKLNSKMWTELFLCNKEPLVHEIDNFISNLEQIKNAVSSGDDKELCRLLEESNQLKIEDLEQ